MKNQGRFNLPRISILNYAVSQCIRIIKFMGAGRTVLLFFKHIHTFNTDIPVVSHNPEEDNYTLTRELSWYFLL